MPSAVASSHVLGLDVGAVSVSAVELGPKGKTLQTFYELHHGDIEASLRAILRRLDHFQIGALASTSFTPSFVQVDRRYDNQICLITAARHFHPGVGSILIVGGERFGLVRFDSEGNYLSFRANTLCAAGTGSFLDQQAQRLNLNGVEELTTLALANRQALPKIATRCAVFAKTDLVHAQQEGYGLEAICDGLCRGLAKNIVDTLFTGESLHGPLLVVGGVAKNQAVIRHLHDLLGVEMVVDGELPYGAAGAALKLTEEAVCGCHDLSDIICREETKRPYEYEPLELRLSSYPDFTSLEQSVFHGRAADHSHPLEVDLYEELESTRRYPAYLGIDIGSTSTKAVSMDTEGHVLAGFYTATAGKPLTAVQLILEAVADWTSRKNLDIDVVGVATTGAGRKFIGRVIGADIILDEITAHARATVELHPEVDTIIEIGGQDSKFTTLHDGRVTLSVMNNVCAAGTGSFIEEQARRWRCPIAEYSRRAEGHRSPIASERCTVFMERDLNHYVNEGYASGEALAAVLHSVRENYLNKVAIESAFGDTVAFQGATARNKALVAAFEQRLGKTIHVSRFCHLTGALGAALTLKDEGVRKSGFRGLSLYRKKIPIRCETCDLCTNHCKLSVAEVDGDTVAYGFLCGRDYQTQRYVHNNTSGFDLIKERRRAFASRDRRRARTDITIGIPAALHLFEDLPFWNRFFSRLGVKTLTSEQYPDAVKDGRLLAGAELCAPLTALHAHVRYLLDRCDYVFLPFYLENKGHEKSARRQFCYYTQFASTLGTEVGSPEEAERILTPLVHYLYSPFFTKTELYRMLRRILPGGVPFLEVSAAFDEAQEHNGQGLERLRDVYRRESRKTEDIHVVLLGRPYTVLSPWMNKRIPHVFASMGIPVFYQDMLSYSTDDVEAIRPLLDEVHWHYAAKILEAAEVVARTKGAYPVLVTSFKCSPDSFVADYFKQILESHRKPFLILQLDEHDSRLGYETRIEAAIRSFRNHHRSVPASGLRTAIYAHSGKVELSDKTLLFPNWDPLSLQLVVASLRRAGFDTRLLEESEGSIRRSLRHNTGQCTPLNIIAQDFIEYVERHELDPSRSVLWIPASSIACNIRLFPHHIRTSLRAHGQGFENSAVYVGGMSLGDVSAALPFDVYLAYMFGGFVRSMGCKLRPYEKHHGETDRVIDESMRLLVETFLRGRNKEEVLADVVSRFQGIELAETVPRAKVAVFGDLYARDNDVLNQDLIHFIEAHGGEVITTPYSSYVKMVARPYYRKWFMEGQYWSLLSTRALMAALTRLEKKYYRYFERVLGGPEPEYDTSPQEILSQYNVRVEHSGESMDNLLKIFYIAKHHPDVSLFVQTSPAFCCPSLVTEAMAREIEAKTGVPVVSVTYDGTGGSKNEILLPYLEYPRVRGTDSRRLRTA